MPKEIEIKRTPEKDSEENQSLNRILKQAIKDSDHTQESLAKSAEVSRASMNSYLNAIEKWPPKALQTVIEKLDFSANQFQEIDQILSLESYLSEEFRKRLTIALEPKNPTRKNLFKFAVKLAKVFEVAESLSPQNRDLWLRSIEEQSRRLEQN